MLAIIKTPGREAQVTHNISNNQIAIMRALDADRLGCERLPGDICMWYDSDGFAKTLTPGITNDYADYYYYGDVIFTSIRDGLPCSLDDKNQKYVKSYIAEHRTDKSMKLA